MSKLRAAVVGVGYFGSRHVDKWAALEDVELAYVVDRDAELARKVARRTGAAVAVDPAQLAGKVDVASVAVPTEHHCAVASTLLDAGIHLLVEKPLTRTLEEADRLVATAEARGLELRVGHLERFNPALVAVRERIVRPRFMECHRLAPFKPRSTDVDVVLDLMIHDIDILLGLVASRVTDVAAAGLPLNGSPLEDVAATQITFENGCVARLLASRVSPDPERTMLIAERDKTVRVDFGKEPYSEVQFFRTPDAARSAGHVSLDRHLVHDENPLRKELEHFIARIERKADPIGTLDDDMRSLELATDILAAMRAARPVPVH